MFVQIDGNGDLKDIITIPDHANFDRWRVGLSDAEYDAIRNEIDHRVSDKKVNVSGFIPGADWSGTPFWPIYESACNRDFDGTEVLRSALGSTQHHRPECGATELAVGQETLHSGSSNGSALGCKGPVEKSPVKRR